jgi:uncharacterized membrane protein YqiK
LLARDGAPIPVNRILAKSVDCDNFQNAEVFLANGGQKGRQALYITAGSYRINTLLFEIEEVPITTIASGMVGLATTLDGAGMPEGQIAGKIVDGHDKYQNAEAFFGGGGQKARQEEVLLAGSYNLNPWFVAIEQVPMTEIPIGHVGVVISYIGEEGKDTTGAEFKHGNLVDKGKKGVWNVPLDPGKYALNMYTCKVEIVPTTNIVLNWATGRNESHNLDKNLSTITVRSKDGFPFNLDVSQIIHIPSTEAPKVIARFGSMLNLVSQVLEPTIGNYFRNSAQSTGVMDFLTDRRQRQTEAKEHISTVLEQYNVHAVDTLIGDIIPPEDLMKTLTDRKLASEREITFETQRKAAEKQKELKSAEAEANLQDQLKGSEISIKIKENDASAKVKEAEGEGLRIERLASANAKVIELNGIAEGGKVRAIGMAEAEVVKLKTEAMGKNEFVQVQVAHEFANGKQALVPVIQLGGNGEGGDGSIVSALIGAELYKKITDKNLNDKPDTEKPAGEKPEGEKK